MHKQVRIRFDMANSLDKHCNDKTYISKVVFFIIKNFLIHAADKLDTPRIFPLKRFFFLFLERKTYYECVRK